MSAHGSPHRTSSSALHRTLPPRTSIVPPREMTRCSTHPRRPSAPANQSQNTALPLTVDPSPRRLIPTQTPWPHEVRQPLDAARHGTQSTRAVSCHARGHGRARRARPHGLSLLRSGEESPNDPDPFEARKVVVCHQAAGWRFDLRHLHAKSGSLARLSDFAIDIRRIAIQQVLPGYELMVERDARGVEMLAFRPRTPASSRDTRQQRTTQAVISMTCSSAALGPR